MDADSVESLIGQLNLGIIICEATNTGLVHLPQEDVKELIVCLETLKNYMTKG